MNTINNDLYYLTFVVSKFLATCLSVMALTNGIIRLVMLYLESCKSHAPPSITVQSGLTEGNVLNFFIVILFILSHVKYNFMDIWVNAAFETL